MVKYELVYLEKLFECKLAAGKTEYLEEDGGLQCYVSENEFRKFDLIRNEQNHKKIILACVTMYNEPFDQLKDTLDKMIYKNLGIIENAETKIIIIVDGLEQFHKEISKNEDILKNFKILFDTDQIKNKFELGKEFSFKDLHEKIIEIDKSFVENEENQNKNEDRSITKKDYELKKEYGHLFTTKYKEIEIKFLVKHLNKRKLNSHLWFFSGFCRIELPNYCFMIDVGTLAGEYSLKNLFDELNNGSNPSGSNPIVAGVCGEIIPLMHDSTFTDVLVHAQKVEYKFSHILDKALESLIGFIPVLPGAFSGYNYQCLEPENKKGPLWNHYFYSMQVEAMSCFKSNIYLAEDRILCYALISSKGKSNILKYCSPAKAFTDVPNKMANLLAQRRRWINGSWFASLYSIRMCSRICETSHSCPRKCILYFQMMYSLFNIFFSFFLVGAFYLAFSICVRKQLRSQTVENDRSTSGNLLILFYLMQLIVLVILSLGTVAKHVEQAFYSISIILTFYMGLFILLMIGIVIENFDDFMLKAFVIGTAAAFTIILAINNCLFQVALSVVQFLIATPIYVNVFNIYAMCNIHDISWGNRPDQLTPKEKDKLEDYKRFRTSWVLLWAYFNGFLAYLLDALDSRSTDYGKYVLFVGYFGVTVLVIRFLGGVFYRCCVKKYDHQGNLKKEDKKNQESPQEEENE